MLEVEITITGTDSDEITLAIDEAKRLIAEGYRSGSSENEMGGGYSFAVTGEEGRSSSEEEEEEGEAGGGSSYVVIGEEE